jgi:hypothetical protein
MIPKCRILIYLPTDFTLGKTWNTRRFGAVCSARLIISQIGSSNELRFEIEIEIGFVNERHPGPIIVAFDHIHMVVCAHGVATWAEVLVTHSKSQKAAPTDMHVPARSRSRSETQRNGHFCIFLPIAGA